MKYTDDELLDELRRLHEDLGHPPSLQEFRDHSDHSATTYYNRFGSWSDALDAAGFPSRDPEGKIETEALLTELQDVAEEYREPPSVRIMNEHGKYSASTYKKRFGSWNEALKAAGFPPNTFDSNIPKQELADGLRELADDMDSPPTYTEMEDEGKYGARTYVRSFGSWNEALEHAGFAVHAEKRISRAELVDELERVAEVLGQRPTAQEMDEIGEYSVATYQRRFGSWSSALDDVFDESTPHE